MLGGPHILLPCQSRHLLGISTGWGHKWTNIYMKLLLCSWKFVVNMEQVPRAVARSCIQMLGLWIFGCPYIAGFAECETWASLWALCSLLVADLLWSHVYKIVVFGWNLCLVSNEVPAHLGPNSIDSLGSGFLELQLHPTVSYYVLPDVEVWFFYQHTWAKDGTVSAAGFLYFSIPRSVLKHHRGHATSLLLIGWRLPIITPLSIYSPCSLNFLTAGWLFHFLIACRPTVVVC